jgi:hypothetical protein
MTDQPTAVGERKKWLLFPVLIAFTLLMTGCGIEDSNDEEYTWNLDFQTESRYRIVTLPNGAAENLINSLHGECIVLPSFEDWPKEPCWVTIEGLAGNSGWTKITYWGPAFQ